MQVRVYGTANNFVMCASKLIRIELMYVHGTNHIDNRRVLSELYFTQGTCTLFFPRVDSKCSLSERLSRARPGYLSIFARFHISLKKLLTHTDCSRFSRRPSSV